MKKRFTIMLEEETIRLLKALDNYYKPTEKRKHIERLLTEEAIQELSFHNDKALTRILKK